MDLSDLDKNFYQNVEVYFSGKPSNVKALFSEAFDSKIIKPDFPVYLHTVITATLMIKDRWEDVVLSVKKSVLAEGMFEGEAELLNRLIIGMLFLHGEKASPKERKEKRIKKKEKDMGARTNGRDRTALGYTIDESPVKSWDEYFYNVAVQAARNSKCFSRRIGAILVKDNVIISTGYNGPPRGIPTCDKRWKIDNDFIAKYGDIPEGTEVAGKCPRYVLGAGSGEKMHLCIAGHAEENSILNCARLGISTKDTTMYMTCGMPCSKCWIKIINAGIKEIVVVSFAIYDDSSKFLMDNSDVKVRLYDFLI